jgi:hypothetical protein
MNYTDSLRRHYERHFGLEGQSMRFNKGPIEKLHPDFFVLVIKPNQKINCWVYCTVGMSLDREDENLIELFCFSPKQDESVLELMTVAASYHRNALPLNLHHTVNIGRPWIDNSKCDHGFISEPYTEGQGLEFFKFNEETIHCYWLIPITEAERDYHTENGCEALEQLFENGHLEYANPKRASLI